MSGAALCIGLALVFGYLAQRASGSDRTGFFVLAAILLVCGLAAGAAGR